MAELSISQARRIVVNSQLRPGEKPFRNVAEVVSHLGYLQIDTISVVERAHNHVLWTRLPNYANANLPKAEEADRSVFEYWAHAAAYLPVDDYRFTLVKKDALRRGKEQWFKKKDVKLRSRILDQVKQEGAIMSKDLEDSRSKKDHAPWAWKPTKVALWQLFMEGHLMVTKRQGFQKVYDLPERVLPGKLKSAMPSREEYLEYLIKRDLRAHGLMKAGEIGYLLRGFGKDVERQLSKLMENNEVELHSIGKKGRYYSLPNAIVNLDRKRKRRVAILSPFDNLVIQRKRLKELFGFDYILECYVPKTKRQFGYFGMPILWGNQIVGQIDLKADRKQGTVAIRNPQLLISSKKQDDMARAFGDSMHLLTSYCGCEEILLNKDVARKIPQPLIAALNP